MDKVEIRDYLVFEKERACPLCNSKEHAELSRKMQFELNCRTVICRECGFCFVSPLPKEEVYRNFYRVAYSRFYKDIHKVKIKEDPIESPYENFRFEFIEKHKPVKGSQVLEIGAGPGRFLFLTSLRGARCAALEPSMEFKEVLRGKGIEVLGDFIEKFNSNRKFDIVYLFHVLEHFYDPIGTIKRLRDLVKDDGVIVVEVPNIWKPFKSLDGYFLRYPHLSYFSPKSLRRLLSMCGFELIELSIGTDDPYNPQWILAVTRKSAKVDAHTAEESGHEGQELLQHLKNYRKTYKLKYAWRFRLNYVFNIKYHLSKTFLGPYYRRLKKVLQTKIMF